LGSARDSRAGFGVLAETNFYEAAAPLLLFLPEVFPFL
jgi:hypothetical protein